MAAITRTYTFTDGTDAYGSQVESEISNIVTAWNNHNSGTSTWERMKVSTTTANPVDVTSSSASGTEVSINNTAADGDAILTLKLSGTQKGIFWVDDSDSDNINFGRTAAANDMQISGASGAVTMRGTVTNDSAASGYIGEYTEEKNSTAANFTTTNVYQDADSMALTAGDWDVTLIVRALQNGATWTSALAGISTTSGDSATGLVDAENLLSQTWASSATTPVSVAYTVANFRVSIASTTTYYAKVRSTFTVGTPQFTYRFSARRMR